MNDKEELAFKLSVAFYQKWRETIIETEEQWSELAEDVGKYCVDSDVDNCILAGNLLKALMDTFNELYKDGAKPLPANYSGREDV